MNSAPMPPDLFARPADKNTLTLPGWEALLRGVDEAWQNILLPALTTPRGAALWDFLAQEYSHGGFYPTPENLFNAFRLTPLQNTRVVILGQDPYHGEGQAHGLSFSVPPGIRVPPSLRNIYKEIGGSPPASGDLTPWARQGVLLLNTVLTVRPDAAASHQNKGWEDITDTAIRAVSDHTDHVVFMLWGSHAQKKMALIDAEKHLVLTAPHPSPLSAHRGFLGCGHFMQANDYLNAKGRAAVDWTGVT